jgi:DNA polymerase I-like protein with 3'-5' exonuclease and polymerase domains
MDVLFGIEHIDCLDKAEVIAFDVETTGLVPVVGGLRLLQLTATDKPVVVLDMWELVKEEWESLRKWCLERERVWVAHNAVFDLGWLQEHHIELNGAVHCTMLASRLTSNGTPNLRHGLAPVLERHMGLTISKEEQRSDWSAPLLSESQLTYAARDVYELIRLHPLLMKKLEKGKLLHAFDMECAALPVLAHMQRSGLPFSRQKLEELQAYYEERIETLGKDFVEQLDAALPEEGKLPRDSDGTFNLRAKAEGSIRAGTKVAAGFNLNSPKQLVDKFTLLLGEAPLDEKTGKKSVSVSALRAYAADHVVVQTYLGWKKAEKRRQMVVALMEHQHADGFIRASYMQLGADTGRMSCRNPNLQQVPRDKGFRAAAEAPEGWSFVVADFGQMELRLAAAVSMDKRMIAAFKDGEDLHTITAAAIYPEATEDPAEMKLRRQVAKSANFGLLYGSGAKGLRAYAGAMGITMTLDEADAIRSTFRNTYCGIANWQSLNADEANRTYGDKWAEVRIPGSELRRYLPGELNRLTTRCNTPIQGAGAAVLKVALAELWPHLRQAGEDTVKLAAVVHDEVVLLVREGQEEHWATLLSEVMEKAEAKWLGDIPPLAEAAWGKTWADAK